MTWLGLWLVGVGLTDLLRTGERRRPSSHSTVAILVGGATVPLLAALLGMSRIEDYVVLSAAVVPLALWVHHSERALLTGRGGPWALASLAGGGVAVVALSGLASPADRSVLRDWLAWMDLPAGLSRQVPLLLLLLGLALANVATGNVLVRVVLVTVGALRPSQRDGLGAPSDRVGWEGPADQLKGGRLLGPMERLLILGLGLAGQVTAAGLVIAAKGLLRFPELSAKRDERSTVEGAGIDEVTEYFLVGSFVSWLLALGSLALAALGAADTVQPLLTP